MSKNISRRDFFGASAATALGVMPLSAQATQKIPNEITDIVLNAIWEAESNQGKNAKPRYEQHLDRISNTSLEDTSYGSYQGIPIYVLELKIKYPLLPALYSETEKRPDHFKLLKTLKKALADGKKVNIGELSKIEKEIITSLRNDKIARAYAKKELQEHLLKYEDVLLAAAAYNSGPFSPKNARVQEQLNKLIEVGYIPTKDLNLQDNKLATDGDIGPKSRAVIKAFQKTYNQKRNQKLKEDGRISSGFNSETLWVLRRIWESKFPKKENPLGIVPQNRYTPNYVAKVREYIVNH
jgi:hypothetical protein